MLFRQKERVQDLGKNNFRDFYRLENNAQTKTIQLMQGSQTGLSKSSNQPLLAENQSSLSGSSWDAKHMDTFLKQSKYSSMRQTQQCGIESGEQFFYRKQQPRIIPEFIDYLNMSKINHIVSDHPLNQSQEYVLKKIEMPSKNYNQEQLALSQVVTLQKPSGYLQELKNTQEQQQKQLIIQRDSTSGDNNTVKQTKPIEKSGKPIRIMGVDNPTVDSSVIYKEEHEKYKQKQEQRRLHQFHRYQSLEKYTIANPNIEFNNSNHEKSRHIGDFGTFEIDYKWMHKKNINLGLNTQNRLFGEPQKIGRSASLRAENIKNQELRGRDYNCICLTKV